jgi:hypothetical protein
VAPPHCKSPTISNPSPEPLTRTRRFDGINGTLASTNAFAYNSRNEVVGAEMGDDTYNYAYDSIGNRLLASQTVASVTSELEYVANALNQYTNIVTRYPSPVTSFPTYDR